MKSKTTLFYCILLIIVSACAERKTISWRDTLPAKVDSVIAMAGDFSGVVLIADSGRVVYHRAFGFKNFDTREPLDTGSVFELASISKQFTSMAIMMLHEEGKLSYEDPLEKYIPGLPYPGITIRHLLTHTSGLPDYQSIMDKHWDKSKVAGNEECIEFLARYAPPRLFEAGEKYEYSNTGYLLLATIAERASGIDFLTFLRERVFIPVEMTHTDIRTQEEKAAIPAMAWGHVWSAEKSRYIRADSMLTFNYGIWLGKRKGPGRISSTSRDLLKWDQYLYADKLVSKETLAEAFLPVKLASDSVSNYGFGWAIDTNPQMGRIVHHSGGNPGYTNHIVRYIDHNRTIVLLCNNAHKDFKQLLEGIKSLQ